MNRMERKAFGAALLAIALGSSGCLWQRRLGPVSDHPSKNVTLLQTEDHYVGVTVRQFWECRDEAKELVCTKACAPGAPLTCPAAALGTTNF